MDDMNAFERQVAGEVIRAAAPARPVDAAAVFAAIPSTTQSPKWRFQSMFSATKFVVAGAIVALFGGFLLAGVSTQPSDERIPAVASVASPMGSPAASLLPIHRYQSAGFHPRGPLEGPILGDGVYPGRYPVIRDSRPFTFAVRSSGWVSDGVSTITRSVDGASVRFWPAPPDGIRVDPCAGGLVREFEEDSDPSAAVAAMSALPATVVSGPSEVVVAGIVASQFELAVPDDGSCGGGFRLWSGEDSETRSDAGPGDTIGIWILPWGEEAPLWIEARTPKGAGPGIDPEITQILASMTAPGDPIFPPAGDPYRVESYAWQVNAAHGLPQEQVRFSIPPRGWRSTGYDDVGNGGGSLVRGEIGTPGGAVITFSRPDRFYADPCTQAVLDLSGPTTGPYPYGPGSTRELVATLAALPGTDLVSGPTTRSFGVTSATELVLRVRDDIGCEPEEFYLWADECTAAYATDDHPGDPHDHGLCLERPDPRPARARGSTIRIWVVEDAGLLIDAETYAGAASEVEREVQQIVDTIVIPSGGAG